MVDLFIQLNLVFVFKNFFFRQYKDISAMQYSRSHILKGFNTILNQLNNKTSYSCIKVKPTNDSIAIKSKEKSTAITSPLTDNFGRHHSYLRISLTEKCNLRCKYCMPAEGVPLTQKSHLLTTDEIIYLAKLFAQEGVRKIRLTGGEPTVRRDIVEIVEKIKTIPKIENVGITTNGLTLTRQLVPLQRAGLDSLNISLDTLKPSKYEEITRRKGWARVIAGIDLAIQLGYKPKINCVLMKQFNDNEICDFVEFTKDRHVDIRFIEYMPFSGNKWNTDKLVSFRETLEAIKNKWPNFEALPNLPNDTSKAYAVPGYKGQLGFITSMTEHFCGTCNRLRLTADGNLKVCLFGNKEISLRDAIRNKMSEDQLVSLISVAVKKKRKQHAGLSYIVSKDKKHSTKYSKYWNKITNYKLSFKNVCRSPSFQWQQYRLCHQQHLTHIDDEGKAKMVDVSKKLVSNRLACAKGIVVVGPEIAKLIRQNNISKGDVLSLSQIAGIMGAKKTAELIPLCHNIFLSSVNVTAKLIYETNSVEIIANVQCTGTTGVEMEALMAVSIAALTVYDMCKAVSHNIIIKDIRLWEKSGGKRDFNRVCTTNDNNTQHNPTGTLIKEEPFYPTHI